MAIFTYGPRETEYLAERDPRLGEAIERIGPVRRATSGDLFSSLCSSIVSQQISGKAAVTVWGRFFELAQEVTPTRVNLLAPDEIQRCGMSHKKAGYIKSAAAAALDGSLDLAALPGLSDAEVVRQLSALPGIGKWTAQMLMIFSMERPDILSYDDLGIRKGLMSLHGLESLAKRDFEHFRTLYSPHGTVASFYLWEIAAGK